MASSCLGDRFAHGKWQHVRGIRDGERLHARNELLECGPRCNASELPCDRGMLDPSLPWSPAMLPLLPQSPLRVLGAPPSSAPLPPLPERLD